jgi:protein O-mannosyl-transferase
VSRAATWLAAIAVLAYLPSLAGPFHFDDYNVIREGAAQSWTLRPLLKASYAANVALDPAPVGFHAVNIALHALNAVLLFLIGKQLVRGQAAISFVAAVLFALHPMQTEAVTYISGRSCSLMASFYLGSLLAYLQGRAALSMVLFVLAAATRETAVTLPAAQSPARACRGTVR